MAIRSGTVSSFVKCLRGELKFVFYLHCLSVIYPCSLQTSLITQPRSFSCCIRMIIEINPTLLLAVGGYG